MSSHHEDETKEAGLLAGGVAYIDKPFSVKLLSAHIDRFTRMKNPTPHLPEQIISAGKIQLDNQNRTLILDSGKLIDLRPMEYIVLNKLINNCEKIVTREELYIAIWATKQLTIATKVSTTISAVCA